MKDYQLTAIYAMMWFVGSALKSDAGLWFFIGMGTGFLIITFLLRIGVW